MTARRKAKPAGAKRAGLSKKNAEKLIKTQAQRVTGEDLEKVLSKSEAIQRKVESGGPLSGFIEDVKLLIAIVQDYWSGKYKAVPFWTIAAIVVALLYVLNPFDIIPDFIPVIGLIDDAAVVAACLLMVHEDLRNYRQWKMDNPD